MIFTLMEGRHKQTFEGFRPAFKCRKIPRTAKFLALVYEEGEALFWWLENDKLAVEELQRFFRMIQGIDVKIHIFQEIGKTTTA